MKTFNSRKSGFSLIELLLVISIIAILSTLGLSIMASAEEDALEQRTISGIERISQVLNSRLEENVYRILPVRLPAPFDYDGDGDLTNVDGSPEVPTGEIAREFRRLVLAEFLRVEFPFLQAHVNPSFNFPQNDTIDVNYGVDLASFRPQISSRYFAKVQNEELNMGEWIGNNTAVSAECLFLIMSTNYTENGQPLISILRDREIGDTDGDGIREVLDAYGDPLEFIIGDAAGNEIILDPNQTLGAGQVRGPAEVDQYRVFIRSINVSAATRPSASSQ